MNLKTLHIPELHKFFSIYPGKKQQDVKTTPAVMYSSQASTQSTQSSTQSTQSSVTDTAVPEDIDMCFDDDIETAMLEQCME